MGYSWCQSCTCPLVDPGGFFFFKIMWFSGNFKQNPPFWANFGLRAWTPLGSKLCWAPPDQNPGSATIVRLFFAAAQLKAWVAMLASLLSVVGQTCPPPPLGYPGTDPGFWPQRGGALSPKFPQNRVFPWKLHDVEEIWGGGQVGPGSPGPPPKKSATGTCPPNLSWQHCLSAGFQLLCQILHHFTFYSRRET